MEIVFDLSAVQIIQFILAIVLPLLVGLVTTKDTSASRKAVLLIAFSVISVFLTSLLGAIQSDTPFDLAGALIVLLGSFITSVAMHFGVWKPTGTSATVQAIGTDKAA